MNPGANDEVMTVMVETAGGVLIRTFESASPLRDDVARGNAAEDATRSAAAVWGLPDFVYRGAIVSKRRASREVGDGLLIVGDLACVIQVKAREAVTTDNEKEQRWLAKHIAKGLRQAYGTIRWLQQSTVPMTNGRGRTIEIDGQELRWLAVVVVDHPRPPEEFVPLSPLRRTPRLSYCEETGSSCSTS